MMSAMAPPTLISVLSADGNFAHLDQPVISFQQNEISMPVFPDPLLNGEHCFTRLYSTTVAGQSDHMGWVGYYPDSCLIYRAIAILACIGGEVRCLLREEQEGNCHPFPPPSPFPTWIWVALAWKLLGA